MAALALVCVSGETGEDSWQTFDLVFFCLVLSTKLLSVL